MVKLFCREAIFPWLAQDDMKLNKYLPLKKCFVPLKYQKLLYPDYFVTPKFNIQMHD
jgi:hypothetical protein